MALTPRQNHEIATLSPLSAIAPGLPAPQLGDLRRYTSSELYAGWYLADPQQRSVACPLVIQRGVYFLLIVYIPLGSPIQPNPRTRMPSISSRGRSQPTSTRHHGCSARALCETFEMPWCGRWRNTKQSREAIRFKDGFQVVLEESCITEVDS